MLIRIVCASPDHFVRFSMDAIDEKDIRAIRSVSDEHRQGDELQVFSGVERSDKDLAYSPGVSPTSGGPSASDLSWGQPAWGSASESSTVDQRSTGSRYLDSSSVESKLETSTGERSDVMDASMETACEGDMSPNALSMMKGKISRMGSTLGHTWASISALDSSIKVIVKTSRRLLSMHTSECDRLCISCSATSILFIK